MQLRARGGTAGGGGGVGLGSITFHLRGRSPLYVPCIPLYLAYISGLGSITFHLRGARLS